MELQVCGVEGLSICRPAELRIFGSVSRAWCQATSVGRGGDGFPPSLPGLLPAECGSRPFLPTPGLLHGVVASVFAEVVASTTP